MCGIFVIERELVTELDALKSGKRAATSRISANKSLTAKLDHHIKNIENERDSFKQEVDTLQKLLKNTQGECKTLKGRSTSRGLTANHKSRKENGKSPSRKISPSKSKPY